MSKIDECLEIILQEMCRRVGATYKNIDFKTNDWFMKYDWEIEEENDFRDWLADYFYKNKEAREELVRTVWRNTKKICRDAADEFVWNYGWKWHRESNE